MHIKMSSAICFNWDQSKILSSGYGLRTFRKNPFEKLRGKKIMLVTSTKLVSSTGQRPGSYCHGVVSLVHASVRSSMHASVNFAFKKLLRNY